MDKETVYGKPPPSIIEKIAKQVWGVIVDLMDVTHTYAAIVGLVVMFILGLASVNGYPIYLQVADNEPTKLLYSPTTGMVMVAVGLLGLGGIFIWFGRGVVRFIKRRQGEKP